ncbi:MAG: insulinase family protein, partial [Leptospiraceae bacterium]|nr:insulinase family protein [Leptospiraceae bacterium]
MKRILFTLIITLLPNLLFAKSDLISDLKFKELQFNIPEAHKEKLDDKITYYSLLSEDFPIAYVSISIYGGMKSSPLIEIPSLLASTLKFGGSESLPGEKLLSRLEALGAQLGISAGYDTITLRLSFLTKDQEEVLTLIDELINKPALTDTAFAKAKRDMIESIRRRNDRTENLIFRKADEVLFKGLSLGKSENLETVNKIKKEDLLNYWNAIKTHKNKIIKVTGLLDESKLKEKIKTIFSPGKKLGAEPIDEKLEYSKILGNFQNDPIQAYVINKDVNQSMVLMTGILPQHNHPDFFPIQLLNYILGGSGFNSYMMQQIRVDRGLAYSASSYPSFKAEYGVFYAYVMTKNSSLLEVIDLMKKILSSETIENIKEAELEKAKTAIINQFVFLFANNNRIVNNQVRFDEDKMPENYLKTYRESIRAVKLEDLKRVGKLYLEPSKLKTIIVCP